MFELILPAVQQTYRENGFSEVLLQIEPNGQPMPAGGGGDIYCALHPGSITPGPLQDTLEYGLDEIFSYHITITKKIQYSPSDSRAIPLMEPPEFRGVYATERRIKSIVHRNWAIIVCRINSELSSSSYPFQIQPIRWRGSGNPIPRGPDWFGVTDSEPEESVLDYGFSVTMDFGPLRRVQSNADISET